MVQLPRAQGGEGEAMIGRPTLRRILDERRRQREPQRVVLDEGQRDGSLHRQAGIGRNF